MTHGQPPALCIRGLRKVYKSGLVALDGIDLDVHEREFFALLGPNGAGKSTTIGILSSLITKTSGTVRIYGHDLDTVPGIAKSKIGLVPQEFNFSQFETCLNIVLNQAGYYGVPRRQARKKAQQYLEILSLWDRRAEQSRFLSGGMKRRLMIARALVHEPRLLMLDEPTAGVDVEFRHGTWEFLLDMNQSGLTILLTTHYLEEAENLCKRLAIIDHGRIVEDADLKTLIGKLRTQGFILDIRAPVPTLPHLEGCQLRAIDDTTLELEICGEHSINDIFPKLTRAGIQVASMRNRSNRLEELFLSRLRSRG